MDDICVCCGEYVPEGRMVCTICEEKAKKASESMPEYSTADLCWKGVREGRSVPTKGYTLSRNGKLKADLNFEEFVRTVGAGEMLLADWYTAMEAAIHREGKTVVLAEKIEYSKTCAWLHTPADILHYALELAETEVRNGKV